LIAFNSFMAFWLFTYLKEISEQFVAANSDAARTRTSLGATIGTSLLLGIWACGDVILGVLFLLTRGHTTIIDERKDDVAYGPLTRPASASERSTPRGAQRPR
jgi:hypothetical protein